MSTAEETMTESVLDLPIEGNDVDATTVRGYLLELLAALWRQGEEFSSKRPFGSGGWEYPVYEALLRAGLVAGKFDEDGYVQEVDDETADALICRAVRDVLGHRALPPAERVAYEDTEWCVWYGNSVDDPIGVRIVEDEGAAREQLRWYRQDAASGVAARRVYVTAWEVR
jgi:hypothetical protein